MLGGRARGEGFASPCLTGSEPYFSSPIPLQPARLLDVMYQEGFCGRGVECCATDHILRFPQPHVSVLLTTAEKMTEVAPWMRGENSICLWGQEVAVCALPPWCPAAAAQMGGSGYLPGLSPGT